MRYSEALDFVKIEYSKNVDTVGESFIKELTGVADILEELGYSLEYRLTAILRNLLRDTEVPPEVILNYCNMDVLEALQLLNKRPDCNMHDYIQNVKDNMLALPVKLAEHLYHLRTAKGKSNKEIEILIKESREYYRKCAKDTKFYTPILRALMELKP